VPDRYADSDTNRHDNALPYAHELADTDRRADADGHTSTALLADRPGHG
jgi:hypothetical protein